MFSRSEMGHHLHQVAHHFLTDPPDQRGSFFGDANHDLAPIFARARPDDITEILQAIDESARCRGGVPHLLRNRRHREDLFVIERGEQKKLREGDVARRQLLGQMQDETTLHFQDDVREPLGVSPKLIVSVESELRRIQTA